jgi:hypothetical protein
MSSTIRVFVNNKRVATGKPYEGKFLQVYPSSKIFAGEGEWRSAIYQTVLNSIRFDVEPVPTPATPASAAPASAAPAPAPSRATPRTPVPTPPTPAPNTSVSIRRSDWDLKDVRKATLPAGKYYIGDLCYALDDTLYDKVFGPNYDVGLFVSKNNPAHVFMMGHTDDGLFRGSDNKEYAVDAGIIGIASEATLDPKKAPYDGGSLYTFKSSVTVKLREDKFIFYGEDYTDPRLTIYIYEEDYEESE